MALRQAKRVGAVDVHRAGAADALAAGAAEGERRIDLVLDLDQGVENHRPAGLALDPIGVDARVLRRRRGSSGRRGTPSSRALDCGLFQVLPGVILELRGSVSWTMRWRPSRCVLTGELRRNCRMFAAARVNGAGDAGGAATPALRRAVSAASRGPPREPTCAPTRAAASSRGSTAGAAVGRVEVAEHQHVHAAAQVAGDGILGRGDDRLLAVEAGVEQHGHAGEAAERLDQAVVARVGGALDRLDAAGAVDVHGRRDDAAACRRAPAAPAS